MGRKYDSKFEAGVAQTLDLMLKAGEVTEVIPQKSYELKGLNGTKICTHKPDFTVTFKDGHIEIWEAKGRQTDTFRLKYKLFVDNYPELKYVIIQQKSDWYMKGKR